MNVETVEPLNTKEVTPQFECANCGALMDESHLLAIKHLHSRVDAGDPMPAGECPHCGALCHEQKQPLIANSDPRAAAAQVPTSTTRIIPQFNEMLEALELASVQFEQLSGMFDSDEEFMAAYEAVGWAIQHGNEFLIEQSLTPELATNAASL